jgi:DNA-directed RNA polymerase subunit RPC12/RpoP
MRNRRWTDYERAQAERAVGIDPLDNPAPPEPKARKVKPEGPPRASLRRRATVFASVLVGLEIPLLLICAALYGRSTFEHRWVHLVFWGLMIPAWVGIAATVLIGGGALLAMFLWWVVTGHDPIAEKPEKPKTARCPECSTRNRMPRAGYGATYRCGRCRRNFKLQRRETNR